jgi:hypothetical protein
MKMLVTLIAVAALAAPVAAFADDTPAPTAASTANQICTQAKQSMGALFAQTYGTFGKCVSKNASAGQQDVNNAAKSCKAQQADPNFATGHDGKTFDQYYGSNTSKGKGSGGNAFGKCVSQAVASSADAQAAATTKAAKSCKAALKANADDFAKKYGTGRNAFGKCVSASTK